MKDGLAAFGQKANEPKTNVLFSKTFLLASGMPKLPTGTVAQLVRASAQQAEIVGSNPGKCQIFYLFHQVLSSVLPWQSVGRFNFELQFIVAYLLYMTSETSALPAIP